MIKMHVIKTWVRELKPFGVCDYVISGIRSGVIQFVVDRCGTVEHSALCQNETEDPANHNGDQNLEKKSETTSIVQKYPPKKTYKWDVTVKQDPVQGRGTYSKHLM